MMGFHSFWRHFANLYFRMLTATLSTSTTHQRQIHGIYSISSTTAITSFYVPHYRQAPLDLSATSSYSGQSALTSWLTASTSSIRLVIDFASEMDLQFSIQHYHLCLSVFVEYYFLYQLGFQACGKTLTFWSCFLGISWRPRCARG